MTYLIVAAHPDDEVLGAGATIYKLANTGAKVDSCILSGQVRARAFRPSDEELKRDVMESSSLLGIHRTYLGNFPNIELNTVPHIELVQYIEKAIADSGADVVFTHHPSDLNNDHLHTSLACQEAARYFQRRDDIRPLKALFYMEVPSATEWSVNSSINRFQPNTFVEVGMDGLKKKVEALTRYRGVMRGYPHPRSEEAIQGLAAYRGGQSGCVYAEAFELAFWRIL